MKAFLQHDVSGLFYGDQKWVSDLALAHPFSTVEEAEAFRRAEQLGLVHAVSRLDPELVARFSGRPPGEYQAGE